MLRTSKIQGYVGKSENSFFEVIIGNGSNKIILHINKIILPSQNIDYKIFIE